MGARVRQLFFSLILHCNLLHVVHVIEASIGSRVLVASLLNLLSNDRLRGIALHPSIHKIQFLDMHSILAKFCKITPIDLNTGSRRSVATSSFMHYQIRVLAISTALHLGSECFLAWLESLRCPCGTTFLRVGAVK